MFIAVVAFVGFVLDTMGKIAVGYTAMSIHNRLLKERGADEAVFAEIRRDKRFAVIGLVMMVVGFLLQLPEKLHLAG